jgi:hypothetical protein
MGYLHSKGDGQLEDHIALGNLGFGVSFSELGEQKKDEGFLLCKLCWHYSEVFDQ